MNFLGVVSASRLDLHCSQMAGSVVRAQKEKDVKKNSRKSICLTRSPQRSRELSAGEQRQHRRWR
jgi:hypothetical protein